MAATLPPHVAAKLLEMLSNDDEFRSLFERDPRQALSAVGLEDDLDLHAAEASSCLQSKGLPSKQALSTAGAALQGSTSAESSYRVFSV